jgi:hypothetical protein
VECDKSRKNVTSTAIASESSVKDIKSDHEQWNKTTASERTKLEQGTKTVVGEQKAPQRELGFS